jgi:hypothetical protein
MATGERTSRSKPNEWESLHESRADAGGGEPHVSRLNLSERGEMSELGLVRYDAMCKAIAACYKVDEAKELRNQARALEVYAAQAMNTSAERKACEIRIRAERRAGELLREMAGTGQRKRRGRPTEKTSSATTLSEIGITRDQSSKWQALAEIPADEFERAVAGPGPKPSTEGMVNARWLKENPVPPVPNDALWLWGTIKDFEREGMFDKDPNILISRMLDTMQPDVARILPTLRAWLGRITCDPLEDGEVISREQ